MADHLHSVIAILDRQEMGVELSISAYNQLTNYPRYFETNPFINDTKKGETYMESITRCTEEVIKYMGKYVRKEFAKLHNEISKK